MASSFVPSESSNDTIVICALYQFAPLNDYQQLRAPLLRLMEANHIYGTLLLAEEGINGTVAASQQSIDTLLAWLQQDARLQNIEYKFSYSTKKPFKRIKVKLKKEIVTLGVQGIAPQFCVGTYVEPKDWNALISDPDVLVIDTRNDYEIQIGTFVGAINPNTDTFRELPQFVAQQLNPQQHKKVAMFCTGGIRCEKSTALLKKYGFDEVYHLKGGILKYLEEISESESLWQGECFVFDDRVAVNHQLQVGQYDQCHACRLPITEQDKLSEQYQQGISCPHCFDKSSAKQKARFSEREHQIQLAKRRQEVHLGSDVQQVVKQRRQLKEANRQSSNANA